MSAPEDHSFNPSLSSGSPKGGQAVVSAATGGETEGAVWVPPMTAFKALGNKTRWEIVQLLADGLEHSASEIATIMRRDIDGVAKSLRLLLAAGVVTSRRGDDRRYELYRLPEAAWRADGALDLGSFVIRRLRK